MRNDLRNILIKDLFSLQADMFEKYHNTLKFLKPLPIFKNKELTPIEALTFGEVISIRQNLRNQNIDGIYDIFKIVFGFKSNDFFKLKVVQFYQAFNWVQEQILLIEKREQSKLSSSPDDKLKSAGIEDLNIFQELNTLIALGEKFGKSPQEVENWTYSFVFSLMYHEKISNEINKRYFKIINKK